MRSALAVAGLLVLSPFASAGSPEYRILKTAPVGGEGGWDYLAVDEGARRLYVSHATRVEVLDADTLSVVGQIPDTPGVHGVAVAADLGRGFVSNGRGGDVTIFDLKTLKVLGRVKAGDNPDAILYDPSTHRVFAFNGRSKDVTVIDAALGTVAGNIPLGSKPEFAVSDRRGGVFVNLEDTSEIAVLDPKAMTVKARHPLAPCEEPSGLAMDVEHRRLFAVCSNERMVVVDADQGRVIATLPTGKGTDGAAFDPVAHLAFSSNGEGTLTVVREVSPDRFEVAGNVPTRRGARTITFDPKTQHLFLSTAEFGPVPPATAEQPRPRPVALPGSFVVLVVGR